MEDGGEQRHGPAGVGHDHLVDVQVELAFDEERSGTGGHRLLCVVVSVGKGARQTAEQVPWNNPT